LEFITKTKEKAMRRGYINNIKDLNDYFEQIEANRWNLYNGIFGGNLPQANCLYRQDSKEMEPGESWSLLQRMIELNSSTGGDFTIYFPTNTQGNIGNRVYLSIGQGTGAVAGIGNVPAGTFSNPAETERRVQDAVELALLRRDVEDLMQADRPSGFWGPLLEKVAENPNVGEALIGAVVNLCTVAAAKLSGTPIQMQHPAVSGPPSVSIETDIEMPEDVLNRCNAALSRIAIHFSDLAQFLENLSDYIEQNPQMAKTLFAQISKK